MSQSVQDTIKRQIHPVFFDIVKRINGISKDTECIIAGGAIRDLYFSRSFRDIDVYIRMPTSGPTHSNRELNELHSALFYDSPEGTLDPGNVLRNKMPTGSGTGGYNHGPEKIVQVFDTLFLGFKIQLMVIDPDITPLQFIEANFDTGLSMAFFDGKKCSFMPEFQRDVKNKTITIRKYLACPDNDSYLEYCLTHHMPKLVDYFPGYQPVLDVTAMVEYFREDEPEACDSA